VNNEASHYVKLFGGNKTGNLTFWLPLVHRKDLCVTLVIYQESLHDARSTKYKIHGLF